MKTIQTFDGTEIQFSVDNEQLKSSLRITDAKVSVIRLFDGSSIRVVHAKTDEEKEDLDHVFWEIQVSREDLQDEQLTPRQRASRQARLDQNRLVLSMLDDQPCPQCGDSCEVIIGLEKPPRCAGCGARIEVKQNASEQLEHCEPCQQTQTFKRQAEPYLGRCTKCQKVLAEIQARGLEKVYYPKGETK